MLRRLLYCLAGCALGFAVAACGSSKAPGVVLAPSSGSTTASVAQVNTPTTTSSTTPAQVTPPADLATKPVVKVPSGPPPKKLVVKDLIRGTGSAVKLGQALHQLLSPNSALWGGDVTRLLPVGTFVGTGGGILGALLVALVAIPALLALPRRLALAFGGAIVVLCLVDLRFRHRVLCQRRLMLDRSYLCRRYASCHLLPDQHVLRGNGKCWSLLSNRRHLRAWSIWFSCYMRMRARNDLHWRYLRVPCRPSALRLGLLRPWQLVLRHHLSYCRPNLLQWHSV